MMIALKERVHEMNKLLAAFDSLKKGFGSFTFFPTPRIALLVRAAIPQKLSHLSCSHPPTLTVCRGNESDSLHCQILHLEHIKTASYMKGSESDYEMAGFPCVLLRRIKCIISRNPSTIVAPWVLSLEAICSHAFNSSNELVLRLKWLSKLLIYQLYTRDTFFPSEEGRQDELDCLAAMYILWKTTFYLL